MEKIGRKDRQCNGNKVEDENNFLFECKYYSTKPMSTFYFIKSQMNTDLTCKRENVANVKLIFQYEDIKGTSHLQT